LEAEKIKGAIRTDFVLSAEIVVIALGTVADASFATQVAVLSGIGLIMTVGVYGIVAGIVKMDDLGLHLLSRSGSVARTIGRGLLLAAPRLMKALTVIGTAAMFLVGGGILAHGIPSRIRRRTCRRPRFSCQTPPARPLPLPVHEIRHAIV
jgi:predicted DNA repair protein MutK